jgi:hypothetical protein
MILSYIFETILKTAFWGQFKSNSYNNSKFGKGANMNIGSNGYTNIPKPS